MRKNFTQKKALLLAWAFMLFQFHSLKAQDDNYIIGVGISDITGQIAETNFFGYAELFFRNSGIRDRQYSRAFIVKEPNGKPVVFVSIDKGGMFQSANLELMRRLKEKYGNLYTDKNVVVSATHTHVSPGGYSHYSLYNTSVGGFYKTNFDILVNGIYESIKQAHESLAPGKILYNSGKLNNASINRSIIAYRNNKDYQKYPSIDEDMTVLRFIQRGRDIGAISWFGVHPTNLTKKFKYCSGDNKGYASLQFERLKKSSYKNDNQKFVAAFANTNAGDMSPNLNQPDASDTKSDAYGEGVNEEDSANIIGERQFQKALELYESASEQLRGPVIGLTRYSDYSNIQIDPQFTDGKPRSTCRAALGVSFMAGAEDGRSGLTHEGHVRKDPTSGFPLDICHREKVISPLFILDKGWGKTNSPKYLPVSILKIGQFGVLAGPGEFTVMAGRRIKQSVSEVEGTGLNHLVFCGYSDAYAGYITTREEYATQQYEGGSTHFGPWTLAAYRQNLYKLATKLANPSANLWYKSEPIVPITSPVTPDATVNIFWDNAPWFKHFGDIKEDVKPSYEKGDTIRVSFWGAHPNNDPKINGTYLEIQQKEGQDWITKYVDRDVETKLIWKREGVSYSNITIEWYSSNLDADGIYRIHHTGKWKNGWTGALSNYEAISSEFALGNQTPIMTLLPIETSILEKRELKQEDTLIAYPNPTRGHLTLRTTDKESKHYQITDVFGKIVQEGELTTTNQQIHLEGANGVYLITVTNKNGQKKYKQIVKQ